METKRLNSDFIAKIKKMELEEAKKMLESAILGKKLDNYEILELQKLPFIKFEKNGNNNYIGNILFEGNKLIIELR